MTQTELAEILKDAFGGVAWQGTGNMEPIGNTSVLKFEGALRKHGWRRHDELAPTPNDPRLD